ncbi:hypothetical protein ACFU99_00400 [Streptomyces sp. NPDC057654]|uniref:hypothetical protein n=1 Tax=Streptomyces sp. NPDC057654 TaxID=3346196 RepID=UPI0036964A0D
MRTALLGLLALVAATLVAASPARADAPAYELAPLVPAGADHQQLPTGEGEMTTNSPNEVPS